MNTLYRGRTHDHHHRVAVATLLGMLAVWPAAAFAQAPVRLAVTGRTVGPPLYESLVELGRDETLRRVSVALER